MLDLYLIFVIIVWHVISCPPIQYFEYNYLLQPDKSHLLPCVVCHVVADDSTFLVRFYAKYGLIF